MPSISLHRWRTIRARDLDELEAAHASIGGTGRGRRYATQQLNQAYAVLLASQFQGFCRELHSECIAYLVAFVNPPANVESLIRTRFVEGRQLDNKNAQAASIGSDFGRLGIEFWTEVYAINPRNGGRTPELDKLNAWRNAIAHQDFAKVCPTGNPVLRLRQVRSWRRACERLARSFDEVMRRHLETTTKRSPWL